MMADKSCWTLATQKTGQTRIWLGNRQPNEEAFIMLSEIDQVRLMEMFGEKWAWTALLTTPFQGGHQILGNPYQQRLGNSVGFYWVVRGFSRNLPQNWPGCSPSLHQAQESFWRHGQNAPYASNPHEQ